MGPGARNRIANRARDEIPYRPTSLRAVPLVRVQVKFTASPRMLGSQLVGPSEVRGMLAKVAHVIFTGLPFPLPAAGGGPGGGCVTSPATAGDAGADRLPEALPVGPRRQTGAKAEERMIGTKQTRGDADTTNRRSDREMLTKECRLLDRNNAGK